MWKMYMLCSVRNIPDESHAYFSSYVEMYLYKYTEDVHVRVKKSQPLD